MENLKLKYYAPARSGAASMMVSTATEPRAFKQFNIRV